MDLKIKKDVQVKFTVEESLSESQTFTFVIPHYTIIY